MIQLGSVDTVLNSRRFKYLSNDVSNESFTKVNFEAEEQSSLSSLLIAKNQQKYYFSKVY